MYIYIHMRNMGENIIELHKQEWHGGRGWQKK